MALPRMCVHAHTHPHKVFKWRRHTGLTGRLRWSSKRGQNHDIPSQPLTFDRLLWFVIRRWQIDNGNEAEKVCVGGKCACLCGDDGGHLGHYGRRCGDSFIHPWIEWESKQMNNTGGSVKAFTVCVLTDTREAESPQTGHTVRETETEE